jgi:hypothetical protein
MTALPALAEGAAAPVGPEEEAATGGEPRSEQITIRPPFDPSEFARDSESRARIAEAASNELPATVRPPPGTPEYDSDPSTGSVPVPLVVAGHTVLTLAVGAGDIEWFDLRPAARRLLLQVDGCESVAAICRRCGLDLAEGVRVFQDLAAQGLIASVDTPG